MLHVRSLGSVTIHSVDYDALLDQLKNTAGTIKERYPEVERTFLFGSFSKKNYTPESDVDILIAVTGIDLPFLQRRDKFIDFFSGIPLDINLHVYTVNEIQKMLQDDNSFIKNAIEEAIEL